MPNGEKEEYITTKWLMFRLRTRKKKTQVWDVENKVLDVRLGYIEWNCGWRKYCFNTNDFLVFSSDCLKDIVWFLDELNKRHKRKKGMRKVTDPILLQNSSYFKKVKKK